MPGSSWSWKERARWGCFPHVLTVPCGSGPGPSPARKQSVRLVTFCCKPRRRWGQPVAPASSLRKKQHLPPPNYLHSSKYSYFLWHPGGEGRRETVEHPSPVDFSAHLGNPDSQPGCATWLDPARHLALLLPALHALLSEGGRLSCSTFHARAYLSCHSHF